MKYDDDSLKAYIASELNLSTGGHNDSIESNRQDAMKYYLGDTAAAPEGRSQVVSTDVADTIEWIMPELMKSFTQNNEVVTFDPTGPEDTRQAEIESRFVYDTLMKNNNGFVVLHTLFKDALLQKNGFVKVYYQKDNKVTFENYEKLTTPEINMLLADPNNEVIGHSTEIDENNIELHDVNIKKTVLKGELVVVPVAPENLRIYARHNSIDLTNCRFICETQSLSRSDLVKAGFDREVIYDYKQTTDTTEERGMYRFNSMGETSQPFAGGSHDCPENELLDVSEAYMYLDMNDDGIAEYVKITFLGDEEPKEILDVEEIEFNPYISGTAIIMSHKLFGLSIYDRIRQLQDIKTALWRNMLDNMYLINNQRIIVQDGAVNLDDLLYSRPGGIIRAARMDAIAPFPVQPLSSDSYNMMSYIDQVRAGRVGVSPDGSIHDSAMGDRVGSQGLEQLLNQKEELVGLIIRSFAETAIKPLCVRIRDLLVSNRDTITDYLFRGEWIKLNPTRWHARTSTTVRVGTGSGNRKEQSAALNQVLTYQAQIVAQPGQALVNESKVFNALNDFIKATGLTGAAPYFLDPSSPEGQEFKKQVSENQAKQQEMEIKERQMLADAQTKIANAEQAKAQAAGMSVQVKGENERLKTQLSALEAESSATISQLQQQLKEAELGLKDTHHMEDLQFKYDQLAQQLEIALAQLEQAKQGQNNGQQ